MAATSIQMMLEDLYQKWFRLADTDYDGTVSGQEAVAFFSAKSGLPQETMRAIWDAGSRGTAWLDQGSFRVICQLIWYAQNNGNQLPPNSQGIVTKIVCGMATLPPPRLAGLDVHPTLAQMTPVGIPAPQVPGYAAGPTGVTPVRPAVGAYGTGPTGGFQRDFLPQHSASAATTPSAAQYVASPTGVTAPMPFASGATGQFSSGYTGQVPMQAPPQAGHFGAAPTGQPNFPEITQQLASKYAASYRSAAKDGDGTIAGGEVLRLLAAVNVDRSVKKDCWDLVAGNKGSLTAHELFVVLYLLDLYSLRGSLPGQLPTDVFPPGVHLCYQAAGLPVPLSLQPSTTSYIPLAQQNPVENLNLDAERRSQTWSLEAHVPKAEDPYAGMPALPPQAVYNPGKPPAYSSAGRLPKVEAAQLSSMQNAADARRLQQELSEAGSRDRAVWEQTQKLERARAESEFFTNALQELTLFKSRSDRTLLDMQSRAESAHREAQEQRSRYEQMFAQARASASQNESLQQQITEAMHAKAEWESKLSVLQQELQALANATPALLVQLEQEIEQLQVAVDGAEHDKAVLDSRTAGLRATKQQLSQRVQQLSDLVEGAKATKAAAENDLAKAKEELDFTKTGEDADTLLSALTDAATVYKSLHVKARAAGLAVPRTAIISSSESSVWEHDDLVGAADWIGFDNAGWTLVDDLPDLPEGFTSTFFISHGQELPPALALPVKKVDPYTVAAEAEEGDTAQAMDTQKSLVSHTSTTSAMSETAAVATATAAAADDASRQSGNTVHTSNEDTPAGASPGGASPAGASPAGASPAGASPAGASPAGASPAGASPAEATPSGGSPKVAVPGGAGVGGSAADVADAFAGSAFGASDSAGQVGNNPAAVATTFGEDTFGGAESSDAMAGASPSGSASRGSFGAAITGASAKSGDGTYSAGVTGKDAWLEF